MKRPASVVGFRDLKDCKRFWLKTIISWTRFWNGTPCWEWCGSKNADGYGLMIRGRRGQTYWQGVHRLSFEAYVGSIPDGMTIDHLCRFRACVNPSHLECVTHLENVLRGQHPTAYNSRKTHCKYGHEFTDDNIYWKRGGRHRECKTCRLAVQEQRKQNSFGEAWRLRNLKISAARRKQNV